MNPKVTVGLLAVLLALGGYVYFAAPAEAPQVGTAKPKDPTAEAQLEIFKFDDRETQRLSVSKGEQQTIVERDADGNWKLQPNNVAADRVRISGILLRLSNLRATRRFGDSPNLQDYGLVTPEMSVAVRQKDGTEYSLLFGAKAPAEAGTYAKRPDDAAVYVVANALVQDLERLLSEPPLEPTPIPTTTPTPPAADAEATGTPTP